MGSFINLNDPIRTPANQVPPPKPMQARHTDNEQVAVVTVVCLVRAPKFRQPHSSDGLGPSLDCGCKNFEGPMMPSGICNVRNIQAQHDRPVQATWHKDK